MPDHIITSGSSAMRGVRVERGDDRLQYRV